MTEWSVTRRFPRYSVHLMLRYEVDAPSDHGATVGWVVELSEGGACVELAQPLRPQTPLRLSLQTSRGAIEAEAAVVWAGPPDLPGAILHGVAFTRLAPAHLQALRDLLHPSGLGRRAGVRLPFEIAVTCQPSDPVGPPLAGRTGDISRDGLLLFLPQALPPGTLLAVTLHTPIQPLVTEGKIIWVEAPERRPPRGPIAHGFCFTSRNWFTPLVLALLLRQAPEAQHRSP